jgi:hypothetical protein
MARYRASSTVRTTWTPIAITPKNSVEVATGSQPSLPS